MASRQHCLAAVAVVMASGIMASAQSTPCTPSMGYGGSYSYGVPPKNKPYSGTIKTSHEQKLPDGNVIRSVMQARFARDSAGRTMAEMPLGCERGDDGQFHEELDVMVNDPVSRTTMSWHVGLGGHPKVAVVRYETDLSVQPVKRPDPTPEELERRQKMAQAARLQQQQQQSRTRTENLGTRDFNGISAEGTRTTRTIPAGEEGNDLPLVSINEMWIDKEMGLTLLSISDDPRTGRTTTEFEELNREEPDPALFAPPAGYTVQEQPQKGMMIEEMRNGSEGKTIATLDIYQDGEPDPALFKPTLGYTIWNQDGSTAANAAR
jgi:hypothetical protein